jgi:hypothetical protein
VTRNNRLVRSVAATATALLAASVLAACGGDDDAIEGVPATSKTTAFTLTAEDGGQRVTGHGISFVVPDDWKASEPEKTSSDGESVEWAVQAPDTDPFPPYVSISAGTGDDPPSRFEDAPKAFLGTLSVNPDYELVEKGETEVPGADGAYSARVEYSTTTDVGGTREEVSVAQLTVFLDMPGGQLTTVRFMAPQDAYEGSALESVRESLVVSEDTSDAQAWDAGSGTASSGRGV